MKEFPVRVELLCRFRTPAQQKKAIEDLKKGQVDVIIGTHRIQKNIYATLDVLQELFTD